MILCGIAVKVFDCKEGGGMAKRTKLTTVFNLEDRISSKLVSIANYAQKISDRFERFSGYSEVFNGFQHSLSRTSDELENLSSSAESAADSINEMNNAGINSENASESVGELSEIISESRESVEDLTSSMENAEENMRGLSESSEEAGRQIERVGEEAEEAEEKSSNAVKDLSEVLLASGILSIVQGIADGFLQCSESAAQFEVSIAKVSSIADTSKVPIEDMAASIQELSSETGQSVEDLSEATYQAISASVDTASAVEFVGIANKLSVGGFTEAATAVDVLTTALNAYGLEGSEAAKISDMLITTQNLGKTSVDELAASVGKVIPIASAYNVEMDNLSTAYALLTAGGIATAETGTYLKAMLNELGDTGSDVAGVLIEETGQSFAELMESGKSLGDVIDILGQSVYGSTTEFAGLWSSSEAGVGALSMLGSGAEKFNSVLGEMRESTGATEKAYKTMTTTTAHSKEVMENSFKNLSNVIGGQLNPALDKLYKAGAKAFNWIGELLEEYPMVTAALAGLVTGLIAVSATTAGITLLTTAINVLTAAVMANPLFMGIAIAAGTIAGIATFVNILCGAEDEMQGMTETTKEQYYELQNLNTEYENACNTFGELSPEALRLKYQVDELSSAYEENKQSVEELAAECDALSESSRKLVEDYNKNMRELRNQEKGTLSLIQKMEDLGNAAIKTSEGENQMKMIVKELNEQFPELAKSYEDVTKNTESYAEAMKKACEYQARQKELEESTEIYSKAYEKKEALKEEISRLEKNKQLAIKEARDNVPSIVSKSMFIEREEITNLETYKDELGKLQLDYNNILILESTIEAQWNNIAEAEEEAAKAAVSYEEAVPQLVDSTVEEMTEMVKAYDEIYEAARESLDSQFDLFEKIEIKAGISSSKMMEAWKQQTEVFNNYNSNLEKLEKLNVDTEFLKKLSDGSAESIGQIASLAKELDGLSAEEAAKRVDELNASFANLSEAKDKTAATMSDIRSDLKGNLDIMKQDLEETIGKMNMDAESKEAAIKTMQAYIDGIEGMKGLAISAAEKVSISVSSALSGKGGSVSVEGNADGTVDSADVFIAGEEGPELIVGARGSTVFPADHTERILSAIRDTDFREKPLRADVPQSIMNMSESKNYNFNEIKSEKKISIEINGNGNIGMAGNVDKESVLNILCENIKPILRNILETEDYEEGEGYYVF